jgi:hypothetical protein
MYTVLLFGNNLKKGVWQQDISCRACGFRTEGYGGASGKGKDKNDAIKVGQPDCLAKVTLAPMTKRIFIIWA